MLLQVSFISLAVRDFQNPLRTVGGTPCVMCGLRRLVASLWLLVAHLWLIPGAVMSMILSDMVVRSGGALRLMRDASVGAAVTTVRRRVGGLVLG